jgi:hypothetical protein
MKQTAVEWLVEQVNSDCLNSTFIRPDMINQAKVMEKVQIIRARQDGLDNGFSNGSWDSNLYYNETFKSE